ncbi:MAG TPA: serine/threonine-protein kinase [Nevskiaceae bacterium]|nr:serine/threonine-protein kinase [Nevskiaceae bacterium]
MKEGFWSKDWFAAVAFSVVFSILAYLVFSGSFQGLERYTYDVGASANHRPPSDRIAVVAIDEESIQKLGRWPWPRNLHAQMLDQLKAAGAKVVSSTVFFSEAQEDPGLAALDEIEAYLNKSKLVQDIPGEILLVGTALRERSGPGRPITTELYTTWMGTTLATKYEDEIRALQAKIAGARGRMSADDTLSAAMKGFGRALVPMLFTLGRPQGKPDEPLPDYVQRFKLTNIQDRVNAKADGALPFPTIDIDMPVPEIGAAAGGIGHLLFTLDDDGAARIEPLVVQHYDELYPSLALLTAASALNLEPKDIEVRLGEGVALGGVEIQTSPGLRMYTHFYRDVDGPAFPTYSFYDVKEGKIQPAAFKDKIVLIGATAKGIGDSFPTPVAAQMAPVAVLAHSVSSILQGDFFVAPGWGGWMTFLALVLVTAYLAAAMPRLGPALAFGVSTGIVVTLLLTEYYLLAVNAVWIELTIPAVLVVAGHLFLTVKKLRLTEKLKLTSEAESAESNKMLGLAFQGQGQLDMAFEKFKRVQPVDDKLLDLLYNLALDFERKRQFNKAESVYQFVAEKNKAFRDVGQKLARAKKLSETVILGTGMGQMTAGGTMVLGVGGTEKPMLGRYEVEKELGKGAMGVVYLGKDPKIGRMVAIKTMALSAEGDGDEMSEVKARFFREAEAAGNLSHPHIVQIFDAGEEHDLAYIAMEFIKGHDLVRHTKPANLLPMAEVLDYIADAADALDYAHKRNIVHRDIKPANLMLIDETKTIKVTDFGVARITDASKTKTGMVLGTPSYMSPEQLAGKKVDGRSDLFSLGVTLYQLLTGSLPFQAESMATLMFKIANEPHASVTALRPDLPPELNAIVDKVLHKSYDSRYQRGTDLARDLRGVLAKLS